ncbi:MAG: PIN domain protein [Candidatus Thermoplasmatota archaeon]
MKLRVYVDTSVIGGIYDDEFKEWSEKLLQEFKAGSKIVVLSDLTLREVEDAPKHVKAVIEDISAEHKEFVVLNEEAKILAKQYITEGAISKNYLVDAQHISIATIFRVDVLVSWNFKHIVNLEKIRLYNSINLKYGYPLIEIRSPREVLHEGERI